MRGKTGRSLRRTEKQRTFRQKPRAWRGQSLPGESPDQYHLLPKTDARVLGNQSPYEMKIFVQGSSEHQFLRPDAWNSANSWRKSFTGIDSAGKSPRDASTDALINYFEEIPNKTTT